jgi:hypothetical protein
MDQWQVIFALIGPMLLQWLKARSWFPWLTAESTTVVKVVWSGVVAFITVIGITITCDFQTLHSCTIGGLDWHSILTLGWKFVEQLALQHLGHTGLQAYAKKD